MASRAIGITLVALGVLFLGTQSGLISADIGQLWPLFILIPGLFLELSFFVGKRSNVNAGLLVPGGILTTIGLLFCFEVATNWRLAEYTWPIYPLAVAIGLFQFYVISFPRVKPLIIPILVLTAVSAISFFTMVTGRLITWIFSGPLLGIALVALGVYLMFIKRK